MVEVDSMGYPEKVEIGLGATYIGNTWNRSRMNRNQIDWVLAALFHHQLGSNFQTKFEPELAQATCLNYGHHFQSNRSPYTRNPKQREQYLKNS
jgi:hypothetical protein